MFCCEQTPASSVAVGELIPGFAAWLRSCIPGGFVVLISENRDWGSLSRSLREL